MVIEILFIIFMVLWLLTFFPGPTAGYPWANGVLAWLSVMMLGLWLFLPMAR